MGDLSQLIRLQEVDSALLELENLKGDLPMRVEELTATDAKLKGSIENNEARLKEIDLEIRRIRGMEADRKSKLDRLQDQLYLVKTNREYDALMTEIDHFKSEIDAEELRELELSEERDRLQEQIKMDKLKNVEVSKELEAQKEELKKTILTTEKEYQDLMLRRADLVPTVGRRFMAMYDRVRTAKGGLAVVPVTNHACGGCHARLTSQLIVEIKGGDTIAQCDVCRRILYWESDQHDRSSLDST